jgi:hypothetical protein
VHQSERGDAVAQIEQSGICNDQQPVQTSRGNPGECRFEFVARGDWDGYCAHSHCTSIFTEALQESQVCRICGIVERPDQGCLRKDRARKFHQLGGQVFVQRCHAGGMAARPGQACNEAHSDRVVDRHHDDSHRRNEILGRARRGNGIDEDCTYASLRQLARQLGKALVAAAREANFEDVVAAFDQTVVSQAALERCDLSRAVDRRGCSARQKSDAGWLLLRDGLGQADRQAAENAEKLAPLHAAVTRQMTSPTSSATSSDLSGPSVTPTGRP